MRVLGGRAKPGLTPVETYVATANQLSNRCVIAYFFVVTHRGSLYILQKSQCNTGCFTVFMTNKEIVPKHNTTEAKSNSKLKQVVYL